MSALIFNLDIQLPKPQDINKIPVVSNFERSIHQLEKTLFIFGPRILIGVIVLILGWWVISLLVKGLNRLMRARDIDPTLRPFLKSLLSITLKILLVLSVATQIGLQTTSFMAALGAAGLAIGLALQGSLANFAGGILILVFKPFKVGDYIGTQKYDGTVAEIQILYTILNTADNKKVVIPNGVLSNNEVLNYSANDNRRIDIKVSVGYSSDLKTAKDIIEEAVAINDMILKDPAPIIGVGELTDNAISFNVWVWVKRADMTDARHRLLEVIKLRFDEAGIKLPWSELEPLTGKTRV